MEKEHLKMTRYLLLVLSLLSLCGLTYAQPHLIAARGAFYRPITTATTIANGASLPFTITVSETNTAFFTLEPSGDIKIIKTGIYVIMAEAPFDGDAQMQFYWNGAAIADTTVGQGETGVLSSFTMLTIGTANTILKWVNPSGHTNTLSASLSGSYKARITLLGVDNVAGSDPISAYLDLYHLNDDQMWYHSWFKSESKGFSYTGSGTVDLNDDSYYLIMYHTTPNSSQVIYTYGNRYPRLATGRATGDTQIVGKAIIKAGDGITIDIPNRLYQTVKIGGTQDVYNSMVILLLDGFQMGNFYSSGGPYSLSSGDRVPLASCDICGSPMLTLNGDNSWSYSDSGIYLIGVHFNTQAPAMYTVKRSTSEAATGPTLNPGTGTLIEGIHLVSGSNAFNNYIEAVTAITINQSTGGPIVVFAIRLG